MYLYMYLIGASDMFLRLLVAAVIAIALNLVIPPFLHLVGLPASGDLMTIIRVCVAAIAVLYVIRPGWVGLPA